jgi:hypothetical protein
MAGNEFHNKTVSTTKTKEYTFSPNNALSRQYMDHSPPLRITRLL